MFSQLFFIATIALASPLAQRPRLAPGGPPPGPRGNAPAPRPGPGRSDGNRNPNGNTGRPGVRNVGPPGGPRPF